MSTDKGWTKIPTAYTSLYPRVGIVVRATPLGASPRIYS
ncbi:MAG: hypothetical protein JWO15_3715, partial [Sphingomonadales bacterium]|nr:hypothetical protein [Sphingomonadales bacterium]